MILMSKNRKKRKTRKIMMIIKINRFLKHINSKIGILKEESRGCSIMRLIKSQPLKIRSKKTRASLAGDLMRLLQILNVKISLKTLEVQRLEGQEKVSSILKQLALQRKSRVMIRILAACLIILLALNSKPQIQESNLAKATVLKLR